MPMNKPLLDAVADALRRSRLAKEDLANLDDRAFRMQGSKSWQKNAAKFNERAARLEAQKNYNTYLADKLRSDAMDRVIAGNKEFNKPYEELFKLGDAIDDIGMGRNPVGKLREVAIKQGADPQYVNSLRTTDDFREAYQSGILNDVGLKGIDPDWLEELDRTGTGLANDINNNLGIDEHGYSSLVRFVDKNKKPVYNNNYSELADDDWENIMKYQKSGNRYRQ